MKERLLALWYVPAPAARLALLRIAVGCFSTFYIITRLRPLSSVASLQDWEFAPVGLVWFLARPLPSTVVLGSVVVAIPLAIAFGLGFRYREASDIGVSMVRHPALFAPLAVLTLFIELGAPLALAHRRVALAWTLGAWAFHIGVLVTMGITFAYPLSFVPFLAFFRLERALPALRALRRLRGGT